MVGRRRVRRVRSARRGICNDGKWCRFASASFSALEGVLGVYIIWRPATRMRGRQIIYVGQGNIRNRIFQHRSGPSRLIGPAREYWRVTWIEVRSARERDGIERYLADSIEPAVGKSWPKVPPVPVSLPRW